ncbi:PD-(D/E)XK nuclease family protein [Leptospira ellisii]|uniref:PD-(D/E)XK nuclease family protein n=2 Tax=Leptospira ellisii TaxID=2023197 RepID=A0AAE4TY10_9LEPT|nr:PD-(D/E)XK nuclease family protein [Leptospira ellisii]MDV6237608.1 PD-(D/E)XK nuclease family protein [Leptospira ellisii]PKA03584.1 nuclease [Leptospira ellisii]
MYPIIHKSNKLRKKLDHYGIEHLSASALNEYITDPAKWVLKYIFKHKGVGPSLWRGSAIENAMKNIVLSNMAGNEYSIEDAIEIGQRVFEESEKDFLIKREGEFFEGYPEKRDKEFSYIEPSIRSGFAYFKGIQNASFQKKFEIDLGIEIPAIGYLDFLTSDRIIELKTAKSFPTELKDSVRRQVALQCKAVSMPAEIVYLGKPTKNKSHEGFKKFEIPASDIENLVDDFRMAARAIRRLLMNTESIEEIVESVFPNYDNYLWDDEEIAVAKQYWRFAA